jgi:hypothetical protein
MRAFSRGMRIAFFFCAAIGTQVACSSDLASMPDGGNEDAPTVPLTEAYFRGSGVVQFHGVDGRLFASTMPGSDRLARGPMEPGGSISFRSVGGLLVTIVGVNPWETISYDEAPELREAVVGSMQLALPGAVAGAVTYDVTCGGRRVAEPAIVIAPFAFDVTKGCLDPDQAIDLVATALDANGAPLAYSVLADRQPPNAGQTGVTTFPAWRTDFVTLDQAVTGLPSTAVQVGISAVPVDGTAQSYIYAGDQGTYAAVSAGQAAVSRRVAPVTDRALVWTQVIHSLGDTVARQNLVQRGELTRLDNDTVGTAELLPLVVNASSIGDEIRWTLAGTPDSADTMLLELTSGTQAWRVFAPPGATSVTLPTLVGALATRDVPVLQALVLADDDFKTWDDRRLFPYVPDPLPAFRYRTSVLVF